MRHGCYWAAAAVIVAGQLAAAKRYPVSSSFGALEVDGVQDIAGGEGKRDRKTMQYIYTSLS